MACALRSRMASSHVSREFEMKTPSRKYFVRQRKDHIAGPYRLEQLRELIAKGRVRPEMEFSEDGVEWGYGLELLHLFSPRAAAGS